MGVVGDFTPAETTDTDAESDEFTFCGDTFEIPPTVGAFALLRYGSLMKGAVAQEKRGEAAQRKALSDDAKIRALRELNGAELTAQAAIYELLKACLGDDQLDAFGELADRSGVNLDGLMEVAGQIQEVIGGRPTRRSSGSSAGPSTTGETSTDGGSGPTGTPEMTARDIQAAQIEAASISLADLPV
jgi:hypothetical protein